MAKSTTPPTMLNLDDLATTPTKTLKVRGKEYPAVVITVQGYIDRIKVAKQIDADYQARRESGEYEERELQIDQMIDLLANTYEGLTKKILTGVPIEWLTAMIDFTLAAPDDLIEKVKEKGELTETESAEGNA